MPTRQRIVTYGISTLAAGTVVLAALLTPWRNALLTCHTGATKRVPGPPPAANVDVVFAIDTTGSMSGLIDGAKRTVWSIASAIRAEDPNRELRVGLVAYRDLGDDYVTRELALTTDIDAVFAELAAYQAAGGGDSPENVDAALDVALHKMQWRSDAKKLVFVVGDAPPASRGDVPRFDVLASEAKAREIVINTIRCGVDAQTAAAFQQLASIGNGEFSTIQQDGGVQQVATPYDDKLAELSAEIDHTTVIVGDDAARARYNAAMGAAAAAPAPTRADRGMYYAAKPEAARAPGDAVDLYRKGALDVGALDRGELPAELRGLADDELKVELDKRVAKRKAAEQELAKIAKERAKYLEDNAATGKRDGFDAKVKDTLGRQLKK
ncbi:MAG: VWA domain-containing protein [Kofleriaceae bacterium]